MFNIKVINPINSFWEDRTGFVFSPEFKSTKYFQKFVNWRTQELLGYLYEEKDPDPKAKRDVGKSIMQIIFCNFNRKDFDGNFFVFPSQVFLTYGGNEIQKIASSSVYLTCLALNNPEHEIYKAYLSIIAQKTPILKFQRN